MTITWKTSKWVLLRSDVLSRRIIVAEFRHTDGGEIRVLVAHMDCESVARKRQWGAVQEHMASQGPMPLLTLLDHNSGACTMHDAPTRQRPPASSG